MKFALKFKKNWISFGYLPVFSRLTWRLFLPLFNILGMLLFNSVIRLWIVAIPRSHKYVPTVSNSFWTYDSSYIVGIVTQIVHLRHCYSRRYNQRKRAYLPQLLSSHMLYVNIYSFKSHHSRMYLFFAIYFAYFNLAWDDMDICNVLHTSKKPKKNV